MIEKKELGEYLQKKRVEFGLSQSEMKRKTKLSKTTISEIERGVKDLKFCTLQTYLKAIEHSLSELDNKFNYKKPL